MICIATFYSHFGAIRFKKLCGERGWPARVMPVPRDLSSSCGSCVHFEGDCPQPPPPEVEQVVACTATGYRPLYRAENS
ncbi:MAG: DUF3343 domain-containing protein [Gemmiger sp.]